MSSSIGDKVRILSHLPKGENLRILEVGAGSGDLARVLASLGHSVVAIDPNPDSFARLSANLPYGSVARAMYADQILGLEGTFDAIIFCSVLHEVYSYGDTSKTPTDVVGQILADSFAKLNPGGAVIVRDGVKPPHREVSEFDNGEDYWIITDRFAADMATLYRTKSKWATNELKGVWSFGEDESFESLCLMGKGAYMMELAYTITWGFAAFQRESQELYGLYELEEFAKLGESVGFEVTDSYSYLQGGYPEHLNLVGKLYAGEGGPQRNWHDSNAIWAFRKPQK
jgi:SAM-dependent methyltransferase